MRSRYSSLRIALAASLLVVLGGCRFFMDADDHVARASGLMEQHDYRAAAIELNNALQSEPQHAEAQLMLADVLLKLSDPEGALRILDKASPQAKGDARTAHLAADAHLALGQFQGLIDKIESGEIEVAEPERSLYLGQALGGLQRFDDAFAAFTNAIERGDTTGAAHVGIAHVYLAQGRLSNALDELEKVLAEQPQHAEALHARGKVYAARGECEQAIPTLVEASTQAQAQLSLQQQTELFALLAESQLACGKPNDAAGSRDNMRRLAGDIPLVRLLTARIALARQDYGQAVAELQRIVTDSPNYTPARVLLGAALVAQGNLNQAEAQLVEVLQQAPENAEARKLLAQVRLRLQRPDAAIQALTEFGGASESDPQVEALLDLAKLQREQPDSGGSPRDRQLSVAMASLRAGDPDAALSALNGVAREQGDIRREALMLAALSAARGTAAAQNQLTQWLKSEPKDVQLLNLAATFQTSQRNFDAAREHIGQALAIRADDAATLVNAARVESAAGQFDTAKTYLERVLSKDPANTQAHLGLAQLALRKGELDAAERALLAATQQEPKLIEPKLLLARVQMRLKKTRDADRTLTDAAESSARRPEVLNAIGLMYLDMGRYDEAISRFRQTIAADASEPTYRLNLARAQLALDQLTPARATLEEALKRSPDHVETVGALMLVDLRERKQDAALERLERIKVAKPRDPAVSVLEGDLYMSLNRYTDAADAYNRALHARPSRALALRTYQARTMAGAKDAVVPLDTWLERSPTDAAVRMAAADAYQQAGNSAQAIKHYEALVSAGNVNAVALNNLAWLYYEASDSRAEATAKRAFDLAPTNPAVADTYGWILVENGKAKEGARVLQQALLAADSAPDISYHYAVALARSGDREGARKRLQTLLTRTESFATQGEARQLLKELTTE